MQHAEAWIGQLNDGRLFGHWEDAPKTHSGWKRGWRCFPYKCNASPGIRCLCRDYFDGTERMKEVLGFSEKPVQLAKPAPQLAPPPDRPRFEVIGSADSVQLRIRRPGVQQRHQLTPDEADALGLELIRKADASRALAQLARGRPKGKKKEP